METGSERAARVYPWSAERPLRLAVVDDNRVWVAGLRHALADEDVDIVFAQSTGAALFDRLEAGDAPDLIIMDVDTAPEGRGAGVRTVRTLRERGNTVPVLLMSMAIREALPLMRDDVEGVGYLTKSSDLGVQGLLDAMARMVRGETVIDARLVRAITARPTTMRPLVDLTDVQQRRWGLVRASDVEG